MKFKLENKLQRLKEEVFLGRKKKRFTFHFLEHFSLKYFKLNEVEQFHYNKKGNKYVFYNSIPVFFNSWVNSSSSLIIVIQIII